MPKRLKNRSIGEPGGNGESPSKLIVRAPPSTLTRTEITEGFTFSTMSAKPTGRCTFWAYAGLVRKVVFGFVTYSAPENRTPAPMTAAEAMRTRRRAERTERGF